MAGIIQYLKDTRGELHHVAWPTRTQTIVYTILIAAVSIFTALYLGLFDYLFTTGLTRGLRTLPAAMPLDAQVEVATTTVDSSTSPATPPTQDFDTGLGGSR